MKEKLMTLPLAELREMAKAQGLKGVTALRKAQLVEKLAELHEKQEGNRDRAEKKPAEKPMERPSEKATEKPAVKPAPSVPASIPSETVSRREIKKEDGQEQKKEERKDFRREEPQGSYRPRTPESRYQERRPRQENSSGRNFTPQRTDSYGRPVDGYGRTNYRKDALYNQRRDDGQAQRRDDGYAQRKEEAAERRREELMALRREEPQRREDAERGNASEGISQKPADYPQDLQSLDSGESAYGILEVMPEGFGFLRSENFLPGENDVYVAPSQIRRFNLKTGDMVNGVRRIKTSTEKFAALLYINTVNGFPLSVVEKRPNFENLTPIFPDERIHLELPGKKASVAMRVTDLLSPIGKGQRGMIVSPPKAGKTTLLKQVAKAVTEGHPEMHLIILLIDERPEEVTDIKEAITGEQVEVIYSTFDELPDRHKRVSEMVIERAKRLVEHGQDVMILLDSMTRLARAYNLVVPPSGRTLSGGLDPAALYMPKRFFGAARNMREGGSLTILATALIDTGSRMDDVVYEEFKGTGNMELVLDRKLSEKRIFPAVDILKSGTRRDDLLLSEDEKAVVDLIHRATAVGKPEESVEKILELFARTRNNTEFIEISRKRRVF